MIRTCLFALLGGAIGGFVIPLILFFIAAIAGDTGGPLFWPLIAIPLGLIGLAVGAQFGGSRN